MLQCRAQVLARELSCIFMEVTFFSHKRIDPGPFFPNHNLFGEVGQSCCWKGASGFFNTLASGVEELKRFFVKLMSFLDSWMLHLPCLRFTWDNSWELSPDGCFFLCLRNFS